MNLMTDGILGILYEVKEIAYYEVMPVYCLVLAP
jgi:hypothetical protein